MQVNVSISLATARKIALAAQGLAFAPQAPATKADVLAAIQRMGALQIDTINVVARSPYLALWSRIGSYNPKWLDELLAEGAIFEHWAHAASFLAMEYYPYCRSLLRAEKYRWFKSYQDWYVKHQSEADPVLETIRQNGAVRSADFERKDGRQGGWWNWKIEKEALEYWFGMGELMIARREKFQRVYDLRERVLPAWDDSQAPGLNETLDALVLKSVACLGVTKPEWVADYFRLYKKDAVQTIQRLLQEGALVPVKVEGWESPALMRREDVDGLEALREPTHTTLLSPFDALVWDRERARQLHGFDFMIEFYIPEAKRKYGYYLMPILHRGRLVGRLDAKAHRKDRLFEVKAIYLEEGVTVDDSLAVDVAAMLRRCADWHGTPEVVVRRCQPVEFQELLEREMERA